MSDSHRRHRAVPADWLSGRGQGDLFLGYTVALLLVTAVTVMLTPETKGKPLE